MLRFPLILSCFFLQCVLSSAAQTGKNDSIQAEQHNRKIPGTEFAIRGKAIGCFMFEDVYFRTVSFGGEVIFGGRHCLGIDGNYFRWKYETDDNDDNAMYDEYERRLYILADYKCLSNEMRIGFLYFNAYCKSGNYNNWTKKTAYDFGSRDMSYLNSTKTGLFQEIGGGLGWRKFIRDSRWAADFSINAAQQYRNYDVVNVIDKKTIQFASEQHEVGLLYIRFNLIYMIRERDQTFNYEWSSE
ncbi:MAG: hypothetical protein ACJ77K_19590 [Bacteroidia bacterium]